MGMTDASTRQQSREAAVQKNDDVQSLQVGLGPLLEIVHGDVVWRRHQGYGRGCVNGNNEASRGPVGHWQ